MGVHDPFRHLPVDWRILNSLHLLVYKPDHAGVTCKVQCLI